jgi:hypothetical protein
MWTELFGRVTGRPWTIERCASREFGPAPSAVYRRELAAYTDAELYRRGHVILAGLMARDPDRWRAAAVAVRAAWREDRSSGRVAAGPNPGYRSSLHTGRPVTAPPVVAEVAPQGRGRPRKSPAGAAASGSAVPLG